MITTVESGRIYLPEGFEPPTTPKEAILAAHALLEEEGRWVQGSWFDNPAQDVAHDEYKDNPFCNSWHACMMGAVGIVTMGLTQQKFSDEGDVHWRLRVLGSREGGAELYKAVESVLDDLARQKGVPQGAVAFNDSEGRTRQNVLDFLAEAASKL